MMNDFDNEKFPEVTSWNHEDMSTLTVLHEGVYYYYKLESDSKNTVFYGGSDDE